MKTFEIVTPENVVFEYRLAGIARRGLAWGFDQLLVMTAIAAILVPLQMLLPVLRGFGYAVEILFYFLISMLYPILFEVRDGQTPGKKALRIRVISDRGTAVTLSEALVRNVVRSVDVLPGLYFLGAVSSWSRRDARRLGDRAAGTLVVEETALAAPSALRAPDAGRHNTFFENRALAALARKRLTPEDREALLDLGLRREFLEERARLKLFSLYAGYLRSKLGSAELDGIADERLVLNCVEALLADSRRPPAPWRAAV